MDICDLKESVVRSENKIKCVSMLETIRRPRLEDALVTLRDITPNANHNAFVDARATVVACRTDYNYARTMTINAIKNYKQRLEMYQLYIRLHGKP